MKALLVVDIQNGFIDGNLAVANSHTIIPTINRLIAHFDTIQLPYGTQVLWSAHCVQGTPDANFHDDLKADKAQLIIRKGYHQHIDSYSAFMEADRTTKTGLAGYLHERGVSDVYVVGIATDFCVAWTAMDAVAFGFGCTVITDATAPIDMNGSLDKAMADMTAVGVAFINSKDIINQ